MPSKFTDSRSNDKEQIEYAARKIGKSKTRQQVFAAICRGKKKRKSISEIETITKLPRKRILEEAIKLHNFELLPQVIGGVNPVYEKDTFLCQHSKEIIRHANNPKSREKIHTKRSPKPTASRNQTVTVQISAKYSHAQRISVDDVDSFKKVKKIGQESDVPRDEKKVKELFKKILGEHGKFSDWGGEPNDLFTSLKLNKKRFQVAFAFKGKGKKGKLTPAGMGKNGDQILRLFRSPAEVFFVQYVGQIDESVLSLMENLAIAKSYALNKPIYFGIINGNDTSRLFKAYE